LNFISRWSKHKLTQHKDDEQNLIVDTEPYDYEKSCLDLLKNLLDQPEFHIGDGLNEYDEDYTFFESRGSLITREMERILARQQENGITPSTPKAPTEIEGEFVAKTKIIEEKDCDERSASAPKTSL